MIRANKTVPIAKRIVRQANPFVKYALGGWTVLNILDFRSGRDISFSGIGQDRADIRSHPSLSSDRTRDDYLHTYFDLTLATFNAVGTYCNSPRNFLRERIQLNLRGEFFNALNKANFGIILSAADPRILQIGARITF